MSRLISVSLSSVGLAVTVAFAPLVLRAQTAGALIVAQVERPIAFDSAGRLLVLSPSVAARLALGGPAWPLASNWTEARLYRGESAAASGAVLVATLVDGAVARYTLDADALLALRRAIDAGVLRGARAMAETRGDASGFIKSEPAGNSFVRNQTWLGVAAYGPATAALLSGDGTAAGGGYLLAAGGSFFVAAQMTRTRSVTRAQTILATHGGFRGAAAGAAIAAIANAHDGPGYGAPILAGALGGTIGGFLAARGMSDGEAAASGLGADMFALTTLGVAGALNAFNSESNKSAHKIGLGAAVAAGGLGYALGPRYARRSAYNVTAGDASVARTGAIIGAIAGSAIFGVDRDHQSSAAVSTAGLLTGFVLSDRFLVRTHDRTSGDATWATLGAIAGGLMGGGVAEIAKANSQTSLGLVSLGGLLGLIAADRTIAPAPDAGPLRGVMRSSTLPDRMRSTGAREPVQWSLAPAGRGVTLRVTF